MASLDLWPLALPDASLPQWKEAELADEEFLDGNMVRAQRVPRAGTAKRGPYWSVGTVSFKADCGYACPGQAAPMQRWRGAMASTQSNVDRTRGNKAEDCRCRQLS